MSDTAWKQLGEGTHWHVVTDLAGTIGAFLLEKPWFSGTFTPNDIYEVGDRLSLKEMNMLRAHLGLIISELEYNQPPKVIEVGNQSWLLGCIIFNMSIRGTSLSVAEYRFDRSGVLHGMVSHGVVKLNDTIEALPGQEVVVYIDEKVLVLTGMVLNGLINGKEFHASFPSEAFGIIGWLFQTDIKGGYIGEPIIGR